MARTKTGKPSKRLVALAAGLGLAAAALGTAVPAAAQSAPTGTPATWAKYEKSAENAANNKAFYDAIMKIAAEKRAAHPELKSVTLYYSNQAPSFSSYISASTSHWNSSVSNVKLASGGSDFTYYEGNDPNGSYASTDGHGSGYVFIDYTQATQYDDTRIVAHETGHILGLPDHYSGPCSELMSGGGPGTSCTNSYPNSTERSRVDQLWANGLAKSPGELHTVR
ncbi:snapalysin [Streptomyces odontomachi]|uniref:snapalysin n=1 Tax=Streptomyces odontomachi TaxID=2944940 RepID=UPI00210E81A7|nr:snapalysin [Streptomyces sp. ODS25]